MCIYFCQLQISIICVSLLERYIHVCHLKGVVSLFQELKLCVYIYFCQLQILKIRVCLLERYHHLELVLSFSEAKMCVCTYMYFVNLVNSVFRVN